MLRSPLAFAASLLLLAGCPSAEQPSVADAGRDAPVAPTEDAPGASGCMPEGNYMMTWTADPGNADGCLNESPVRRVGARGQLVTDSLNDAECPASCGVGDCTLTNAAAPTCSGRFETRGACSETGSTVEVTYTITGSSISVRSAILTTDGNCIFTGTGTRIAD